MNNYTTNTIILFCLLAASVSALATWSGALSWNDDSNQPRHLLTWFQPESLNSLGQEALSKKQKIYTVCYSNVPERDIIAAFLDTSVRLNTMSSYPPSAD